MKRCPQCEFIYEDDQSLCDMDGILLVFDSQNLPKQVTGGRLQLRNRIVPAIAVLVLTTVFFLVYYVSTRQSVNRVGYSPTSVSGTQPTPAANQTLPSVPEAKATAPEAAATPELKTNPKPSESTKAPTKSKSSSRQQRETLNKTQEKDSKIGSLIKKTGRILKKPFKF